MKVNDYVIATCTIRGQCKEGRRYKILKIHKEGTFICESLSTIIWETDYYCVNHNNNYKSNPYFYFKYDYEYNRKIKLKKLNKI